MSIFKTYSMRKKVSRLKKIRYICDRCGEEIIDACTKIVPHYFDMTTEDLTKPLSGAAESMHFCIDCTMHILEEMQPIKTEEQPVEKPTPEKPKKKEKSLDAGKVMALHQAGWDNDKIADEMGVTARQVYQCIYYQQNKKSLDHIREKEEQP